MSSVSLTKKIAAFMTLCKWRVNSMIVFTALIGMVLASPYDRIWQSWRLELIVWAMLGIALVAGAAAAINHVIECTVDALMKRTDWRPLPKGLLSRSEALIFSIILAILGLGILYKQVNPLTMWLTFATFIGYALIYTAILKPATPQNIVIGGVAGSMPPVLGWVAMTEELNEPAFALFLIIFLWTPPHFWALACYRLDDYRKSGLPMMPVTHGIAFTCLQSLLYTLLLAGATLLPYLLKFSGVLYLVVVLLLNAVFITYGFRLWRNYSHTLAHHTFRFSIIYLLVLFVALLLDHFIRI